MTDFLNEFKAGFTIQRSMEQLCATTLIDVAPPGAAVVGNHNKSKRKAKYTYIITLPHNNAVNILVLLMLRIDFAGMPVEIVSTLGYSLHRCLESLRFSGFMYLDLIMNISQQQQLFYIASNKTNK